MRIDKTIEKIQDQALKYVQDELSTIETLLSRSAGRSEEIHKTIDDLQGDLQKVGT